MTILSCTLANKGHTGSWKQDHAARQYVNTYHVRSDNCTDNQAEILNQTLTLLGFSMFGGSYVPYPSDDYALLVEASADLVERTNEAGSAGALWQVRLTWSGDSSLQTEIFPWLNPPDVSSTYEKQQTAITKDLSEAEIDIVNSAVEPFDSPPTVNRAVQRWQINQFYEFDTFDTTDLDDLIGTTNSTSWWKYNPYDCLMDGINLKLEKVNSFKVWNVSFTILVDLENGFEEKDVLDTGYRELIPDPAHPGSSIYRQIFDSQGVAVSKPVMLNGGGGKLAAGSPPVYLVFQLYKFADWSIVPEPE